MPDGDKIPIGVRQMGQGLQISRCAGTLSSGSPMPWPVRKSFGSINATLMNGPIYGCLAN